MDLLDKMLEGMNRGGKKFITPFLNTFFKCKDKKVASIILTINLMRIGKFKKFEDVLKNGCFTLAIKF